MLSLNLSNVGSGQAPRGACQLGAPGGEAIGAVGPGLADRGHPLLGLIALIQP